MNSETTGATIQQRAHRRFKRIRLQAAASITDGTLAQGISEGQYAIPTGLCISSIARVSFNAPEILPALGELAAAIANTGDCYLYPPDSLHISLLALTQREQASAFDTSRADRLIGVANQVLSTTTPCEFQLGRVNLLANQWFLEVLPTDDTWVVARRRIANAARSAGEEPIVFADTEPIHLNMGRINAGLDPVAALALLAHPATNLQMHVAVVDIVVTDFVVSRAATIEASRITLSAPN